MDPQSDTLDGLIGFLVDGSERIVASAGLDLVLDLPSPVPVLRLASGVRRQLALVVQEAVTNAVKHSAARKVTLRVSLDGDFLNLSVEDDGNGRAAPRPGGRGLAFMEQRVRGFGGELVIESNVGSGTRIRVRIPRFGMQEGMR